MAKKPSVATSDFPKTKDGPLGQLQLIDVALGKPIYVYEPPVNTPTGSAVFDNGPLPSGVKIENDNMKSQVRRYWGVNVKVGDVTK